MADAATITVSKVESGSPSTDGKLFAIRMSQLDHSERSMIFPADQLMALVDLAAVGHSQSHRLQNINPNWREFHKTSWFELSQDKATGLIILSLTFGAGGTLSFSLPDQMPAQIIETLQTMTGQSKAMPSGTRPS